MKFSWNSFYLLLISFFLIAFQTLSFKQQQLKYPRVRQAYQNKESSLQQLLKKQGIQQNKLHIYLRAFKQEKEMELWGKNAEDKQYRLIRTYDVCSTSGVLGPKRKQGDLQIPEGYYHIDRFNPYGNFHLSLGVNYPNRSDKILGVNGKLGGDIFIHGACVTIGCLPITDAEIEELYIFCTEAKNNGQTTIPVSIFPAKLTDENYQLLTSAYNHDTDRLGLWEDLRQGYLLFNESKQLPSISFLNNGRHRVSR